jgi:hypothetical protein
MLGLTDPQLKIIMTAANTVPVERRGVFLERVGAMLRMRVEGPQQTQRRAFNRKCCRRSLRCNFQLCLLPRV